MKIKPFLQSVLLLITINCMACKGPIQSEKQHPKPLMTPRIDSLKAVIDSIRENRSHK